MKVLIAVNGTLMRGFEMNPNLVNNGAQFVCETYTTPNYRLWSINDRYPAMQYDKSGGKPIAVEIWRLNLAALFRILQKEPQGLCLGRIDLQDSRSVLGILGEAYICEDQKEITSYGGWRKYISEHQQLK
jgi:gamma-glutamylcyclotransferase (GGCT)/AIG2-like uncharacterized protein YtfP